MDTAKKNGRSDEILLEVRGLKKHFPIHSGFLRRVTGYVKAVDGIDFYIKKGETLGLVGESGVARVQPVARSCVSSIRRQVRSFLMIRISGK